MKRLILALVVLIPIVAVTVWAYQCPCDQTPGLFVRGNEATSRVSDWSFANQVPLCQVQVETGLLPHALNLNCWADRNGDLYLSCGNCDGKRWSKAAVANNQAHVRVGQTVYPVTLTRVVDEQLLDQAWSARGIKLGSAVSDPRPGAWWTFKVTSR